MIQLSIIIPCFNCSDNILNIINLLLKQIHESVEIIFINDGSTDDTAEIIQNTLISRSIHNFKLYNFSNAGAAKARTRGLEISKGEYIFFLDSDDLIESNFINDILECIKIEPDIIFFSSIVVSPVDSKIKLADKVIFNDNLIYSNPSDFLQSRLEKQNWTSAVWTYVFRRELIQKSNAYFTNRIAHEDHIFSLRLLAHSKKIQTLRKTLYLQRRTIGSLTTSNKNRSYILERFRAFEESLSDMPKFYNKNVINLYQQWSISAFIKLYRENYRVAWFWILNPHCYYKIWLYKKAFFAVFISFLTKRLKRVDEKY